MDASVKRILLFIAFIGASAHAEDISRNRLHVGDRLVDGRRLIPYENSWKMSVTTKDGITRQDAGIWRDRFEVIEIAGKEYGLRLQGASFKNKDGEVVATTKTTNVFERSTMAPITREFVSAKAGVIDEITRVDFNLGSVSVATTKDGKAQKKRAAAELAFDFDGGMYALIWAALPLKKGFSATLPSYSEGDSPATVFWPAVRVTGAETIDAGTKGKLQCWVVEGDSETGPLKYWMSTEPPYIIRLEFKQSTTGAVWVLTMS